jgi:hypothetical protein
MPWDKKNWVALRKHEPRGGKIEWEEVVKDTGEKNEWARFKNDIPVKTAEKFQKDFESEGRLISDRGHERYYYVICSEIIGASEGQETKIVKVKWLESGTVHGQPYAESQLLQDLKKLNPQEHAYYLKKGEADVVG